MLISMVVLNLQKIARLISEAQIPGMILDIYIEATVIFLSSACNGVLRCFSHLDINVKILYQYHAFES